MSALQSHFTTQTQRAPTVKLFPLDIALKYAGQGFKVIPVNRATVKTDRKPLVPFKDTPAASPDEIRAMWAANPTANPVIVCGAQSGIIALDVDGPDGLAWLVSQGLPPTFTVSRGAPGRYHFWFKTPGFKVGCRTLHPQVEVKGHNGLIPCPGALHWTGAPYRIVKALDIADCPAWLQNLLKPMDRPAPTYQPGPDDDTLIPLAIDALSAARSSDRQDWLAVGMALKAAGEQYKSLFDTFSARCPEKYNPRTVDTTWSSFKRSGIGLGSLFWMADQDTPGWRPVRATPSLTPNNVSLQPSQIGTNLPAEWPAQIPAGVISAALLCSSAQIALALIARGKGYQPGDLIEPADLVGQLGKRFVYRALKDQGAVYFVTNLPVDFLPKERDHDLSQGNSVTKPAYRHSQPFTLRAWGDILTDLYNALPDHLLRFYFPSEGEHTLLPTCQLDRLILDDDRAALEALTRAAAKQDQGETRRAVRLWRQAVQVARTNLYKPDVLAIGENWHNLIDLRRYLTRAIHDANPTARDYTDWQILTGVTHRSVKPLLTGAGLKNEPQTIEVQVNPADPIRAAKKAAYQVGKIAGFMVTRPDGTQRPVYEPLDQAAETLAHEPQGVTVSAILRTKSKQVVVSEVHGTVRRAAITSNDPVQGDKSDNQKAPKTGTTVPKLTIPRLDLPAFDAYRRDCFILAYQRNTGEIVDPALRRSLNPRQAWDIMRGAAELPALPELPEPLTREVVTQDLPPAPTVSIFPVVESEVQPMAYQMPDPEFDYLTPSPDELPAPLSEVHPLLTPVTALTADEIRARQFARHGFSIFGNGQTVSALTGTALAGGQQ